ncbi:oxaloacetate decarboxylase, alpha subunit [Desulfotomaculum arcticum]|uniref:Oxaloacetate decarboxylase, alpha subunit n=1 Tax=Desulfotruncus arcticus DSM 17038 TaxID=1121424 RepID=A0A1I2MPU2_9FIRM|nr:acetyl-CoA carboxylase biotin carboxyl carrier protein [Desulfotruncus arcticus]SFF93463.1 oxaloacetate decarboxylase, alpha subunit [Desulfotomaculum arcticum] [Desulfotruncus arcticus DSM 17038]
MRAVKITDTTLRDGHQSLWATRMRIDDMLPIVEKLDRVGYHSLEVWGGATFDVCLRYLNEDPWERLRIIKSYVKRTPLQMLLRGQSLVGYQHYPDDVVEAFVTRMVENGIDIIRIFDALNDIRNMETAIKTGIRTGAHVQASVVYTISPVHNTEHYLETAVRLEELGVHSICVKDMAGLLTPYQAYELISKIKAKTGLPVQLHSHYIGGLALATYLKAVEAGVDVIDTAAVPLAFGASQPPVETVVRALQGTPYDTGLDMVLLFEIAGYFEEVRKERGYERGVTRINDMRVFEHQVPGGMITNLVTQLEEQKSAHLLPQVLNEIPRVRRELGYPPLVTPTSQIVGTQAVLNVLLGERYKLVPGEVKAYFQGLYGKPPAPVDEEIARKVLAGKKPITCRPADMLEPRLQKVESELQGVARSAEDVISYAIFPQITKKFWEQRRQRATGALNNREKVSTNSPKEENEMDLAQIKELIQVINQTDIAEFSLDSDGVKLAIRKAGAAREGINHDDKEVDENKSSAAPPAPPKAVSQKEPEPEGAVVKSPMVGTFYRAPAPEAEPFVEVGTRVEKGQTLCIIEAMKLMNEIESEVNGTVVKILVDNAQTVEYGQPLVIVQED